MKIAKYRRKHEMLEVLIWLANNNQVIERSNCIKQNEIRSNWIKKLK
jgi:hypothetical protein